MSGRRAKRKRSDRAAPDRRGKRAGASEAPRTTGESRCTLFAALGVFALALLLRLAYLGQIQGLGFFTQPVSDAFVFVQRARGIAAGDWLGPADFVHAPLYAYVLGIVRILAGEVWAPRLVQCLFGATACALLVLVCRRLFDNSRTALLAGLGLAVYPPAVFFDGLIQKTSLALLLSTALLWLLIARPSQAGWRQWAAAGVTLGLLALTRQNALALLPLVLAWICLRAAIVTTRVKVVRSAACAIGLVAALLPWAVRNRAVLGDFVLTTPNLGQNFAMGNSAAASGTYLEFKRGTGRAETEQRGWAKTVAQALGRPPTAREVSDYYLSKSLAWIRENPGQWLRLLGKKWLMVWNAYEAFDTEDYYLYRARSPLLAALDRVWHFGVLAPLAAAGLVLTLRSWRRLWLLYGWLLVTALAVAVFVVFARYRFPLIPVLVMFAAAGLVEGVARIRQRQYLHLLAPGVALVLTALVTNWTIDHPRRPDAVSHTNHAIVLRDAWRYDDALAELRTALAISPKHVGANLAMCNTLAEMGRYRQALTYGEQARAGAPDYPAVYRGLGDALAGLGRVDQAIEAYRRALELDPEDYRALNMLATSCAQQGRTAEALELFARMLAIAPDYPEGHLNLGNTYLSAQRLDEAAAAYERALGLRPVFPDALHNLGVVELSRGNLDRAIELFRRVLEADASHELARRNLADAEAARQP